MEWIASGLAYEGNVSLVVAHQILGIAIGEPPPDVEDFRNQALPNPANLKGKSAKTFVAAKE